MVNLSDHQDPAHQEAIKKRHFAFRLNVFFFSTFLLFSILVVRLAYLQFVQSDEMKARETDSNTFVTKIAPIRGNIFDRNEYAIAYTESTQSLFFRYEPGNKDSTVDLAKRLSTVLGRYGSNDNPPLTAEEIIKKMDVGYDLNKQATKQPGLLSLPRRIKEGLSQREIAYLLEHKDEFKGLEITEESVRKYDSNTIAVQLIGYLREYSTASNQSSSSLSRYKVQGSEYLNEEYVGFDGLELLYQDVLRGKNGSKTYPINAQQKIVGLMSIDKPDKGNNLILSLDKDVQLETENAILNHLDWLKSDEGKKLNEDGTEAVAGYAVAMEIATGHVVAMASMPDYDPNVWWGGIGTADLTAIERKVPNGTIRERYADLGGEFGNHPTSLVPLGSTIKPLSVLIGLNEGLITPEEKFKDIGYFEFGRKGSEVKVNNAGGKANGMISATSAIRFSSNAFMSAMIGNRLYLSKEIHNPLDVWDSYMKKFGLGVTTESGLPGESAGDPYYYKTAERDGEQPTLIYASFGQQGRYTALQLAQYVTTLATRGKRLQPQFVQKITDYEGNTVEEFDEPIVLDEVSIPEKFWDTVIPGMQSGVSWAFEGFPYDFRRKTGTSESDIARQRVENAVFIAYAPADKPKLAVAVVVPEGGFGGWGAAPIARKIFDAYDRKIGLTDKGPVSSAAVAVDAGKTTVPEE